MRLKNVKGATKIVESSPYIIQNPIQYCGHFCDVFQNQNPIYIEIGMGKGNFIIENAKKYPNINFIGIEKYDSVMIRAVQKLENTELNNLKLIRIDANEIEKIFSHEIDLIYLNFSDPWPKTKHHKRRLTSPLFLETYDKIFKDEKHIVQKTDNIDLFAYSLEELSKHGYTLEKVSLDLANEKIFNVKTEYEEKFMNLGYKINYVDARKK